MFDTVHLLLQHFLKHCICVETHPNVYPEYIPLREEHRMRKEPRKIDMQGDTNIHWRKYGTTVLICSDLYNVNVRIRTTLLSIRIVEGKQIVKI